MTNVTFTHLQYKGITYFSTMNLPKNVYVHLETLLVH